MEESTFFKIIMAISLILPFIVAFKRMQLARDEGNPLPLHFSGWVLFSAPLLFMFLFGITFWADAEKVGSKEEHYLYIYSLKNSSEMRGDFVLGTGSIGEEEYYYYFYKGENGYVRDKMPVGRVSIQENDNMRPKIVRLYQLFSQDTWIKWRSSPREDYIMYVPKNTVVQKFSVY